MIFSNVLVVVGKTLIAKEITRWCCYGRALKNEEHGGCATARGATATGGVYNGKNVLNHAIAGYKIRAFAGTRFEYVFRNESDFISVNITGLGPTKETIHIVILSNSSVNVHYEYNIPKKSSVQADPDNYIWVIDHFAEKNTTYMGGIETLELNCVRQRDNETVDHHLCGIIDNENCTLSYFDCCSDNTTAALGPNNEGCGCETTEFNCCSDGRTPAKGPNFAGCTCDISKYGCCLDGITEAQGENLEGCPKVFTNLGAACSLRVDIGTCQNFTFMWFFNTQVGGCSEFYYGGCGGNDNRFRTEEDCKKVCVEPKGRRACFLPKASGHCGGRTVKWYYDSERKQCDKFKYGGCFGNNNKFESKKQCEDLCVVPTDDESYCYPNTQDSEFFTLCDLVVKKKYCDHKKLAKVCCQSCMEAGQL